MKKNLLSLLALCGVAIVLSGCGQYKDPYLKKSLWTSPEFFAMGVAVDLAYTKKTPIGHIVSWITGRDCSILRVEAGKTYCKPKESFVQPKVYCYRTLSSIECYDVPKNEFYGDEVEDSYKPMTLREQRRARIHKYYKSKAEKEERTKRLREAESENYYPTGGNDEDVYQ